jgi:MtrB/PioB family decaheme-associated outer membrane protein
MKPRLISILVANLFVASSPLFAADGGMDWTGSSVSIGARHVDDKARDPSKLNEYRDLDSAVIGGFEVRGRGDTYYLNGYGENLGRDDQYLDLKGGAYGKFKYRLYSDELRHNFGSGPGAISPFSGIGGSTLTATLPNPNTATWNSFDHSYRRRDWGGMAEWQAASPWYFRGEANEVTRKGINVFGGANGTSPGNGFMDLPSPIDYTTHNYSGEVGYSTKRGHVAVNVLHSTFSNGNDVLRWSNGFFGGFDTTILPPDNELTRFSVNGNLRQLPGASTLAGRVTYGKLTNDVLMQQTMLSTGGTNPATNPSSPSFHGEYKDTTASLSLTSHPMNALDTRVYWNYAKRDNDSTRMEFTPAQGSGLLAGGGTVFTNCTNGSATVPATPCEPEFFHYKKNNLGIEGGYRANRANKLSAGFDYYDVDRERVDFHSNKDKKIFVEWKNSSLDTLTSRLKYQYLQRRSEFSPSAAVLASNPIDAFVRRFDLANVDQNLVKLVLDASPVPFLDLGFEAIYKNNDYKDTILGRTEDKRQEYYASISFGDPRAFRVLVFGDVEYIQFDSSHRVGTGNPDPATAPTAATFNWSAENKDRAWQLGLGADWVPMARLTLKSSLIWAKTEGTTDFAAQAGAPVAPFLPIQNFDNTRRTSLNLRAIYNFSRQWEFTGGYAYEKYRYSDIGYDNTQYVTATNTSAGYVTGQFSFQPYTANIFYAVAKYKF